MKKGLIFILLLSTLPLFAGAGADVRKADKLYRQKKYGQALSAYRKALQKDPENLKALFGEASAAYYLKDYDTAEKNFENLSTPDHKIAQDALFNAGTTYYRAQNKEKAKEAYRKALLNNPNDKEAVHNYQIILEEENQDQKQDNNQNQDQNQNQQNQNNNQNQNQDNNQDQNNEQNPPDQQDAMDQDDAQRVMQMARDSEHKQNPDNERGQNNFSNSNVDKDW